MVSGRFPHSHHYLVILALIINLSSALNLWSPAVQTEYGFMYDTYGCESSRSTSYRKPSPAIYWSEASTDTMYFELLLVDAGANGNFTGQGSGWIHWNATVWSNVTTILDGVSGTTSFPGQEHENSWREAMYGGPCPPTPPHTYILSLTEIGFGGQLLGRTNLSFSFWRGACPEDDDTRVVEYSRAFACLMSVPFDEGIRRSTLDTLVNVLPLYVFTEMAQSDQANCDNCTVDLIGGLESLNRTSFTTDYEFHEAVATLFRGLRDAHTAYEVPLCYERFVWRQAFGLVVVHEFGRDVVRIATQSHVHTMLEPLAFLGGEVTSINNVPALKYLESFALLGVGITKNASQRLLFSLAAFRAVDGSIQEHHVFDLRIHHSFQEMPKSDSILYGVTLVNGTEQTIVAPWLAVTNRRYSSQEAFVSACRESGDKSFQEDSSDALTHSPIALRGMNKQSADAIHAADRSAPITTPAGVEINSIYSSSDAVYIVRYGARCITLLKLNTMDMVSATSLYEYAEALQEGYSDGCTTLVVDLSGNGGGHLCSSKFWSRSLLPDFEFEAFDLKSSALSISLAKDGVNFVRNHSRVMSKWRSNRYVSPNMTIYNATTEWITPGISLPRGGSVSNFSAIVDDAPHTCKALRALRLLPFNSSEGVVLTDSRCGSACAVLGRRLQIGGYRAVTVGTRGAPPFAFPGGEVTTNALLDSFFAASPSSLYPSPLPTSASYRIATREAYLTQSRIPTSDAIPFEFAIGTASTDRVFDFHNLSEAMNPSALWGDIIEWITGDI